MNNIIDSFLVSLGFQSDTKGAEDYKKSLDSVKTTLETVAGVAAAAAGAIGWVVHKAAESMAVMYDFAEINNVSAVAVDALGKAAIANNSSLEAVKTSIQGLNGIIGEASLGVGRGAMIFEKLGLSAKDASGNIKDSSSLLEEVSGRIQNMSRPEQLAYLSKLRIDPTLIMLLKDGPEAFKEMKEEYGAAAIFKEEDYAMAEQVDKLFNKASASVGIFAKQISVSLFPVIKQVLEGYLAWFKEQRKSNAETFAKGLKVVVAVVQTLWDYVVRLATGVKNVITWMKQFEIVTWAAAAALGAFVSIKVYNFTQDVIKGLIGMTRAMLGFSASSLIIPIAIGAVITALALLIDEFINFSEGNESFLGDLVKEYPQLLGVINTISDGVARAVDWVTELFNTMKPAFIELGNALLNLFTAIWPVISATLTMLGEGLMVILPIVAAVAIGIVNLITWAITKAVGIVTWLANAFAVVINGFASGIDWIVSKVEKVVGFLKDAAGWLSKTLGMSNSAGVSGFQNGTQGVSNPMGDGFGSSSFGDASQGPLGVAAMPSAGSTTVTQTTQVNIPGGITVVSPDPAKAGDAVKEELNKANKQATRNGQSAVKL